MTLELARLNNSKEFWPEFRLRVLGLGDLDQLETLERTVFSLSWSKKQLATVLAVKNVQFWGIVRLDQLIGYISWVNLLQEAEIWNVAVLPEYRRQGWGSSLLKKALFCLKKNQVKKVFLEVRASNLPAQQLYLKFGFCVQGRRKNYYSDTKEDALIMVKEMSF